MPYRLTGPGSKMPLGPAGPRGPAPGWQYENLDRSSWFDQVAQIMADAGVPIPIWAGIMGPESRGNPNAVYTGGGREWSVGLYQLNLKGGQGETWCRSHFNTQDLTDAQKTECEGLLKDPILNAQITAPYLAAGMAACGPNPSTYCVARNSGHSGPASAAQALADAIGSIVDPEQIWSLITGGGAPAPNPYTCSDPMCHLPGNDECQCCCLKAGHQIQECLQACGGGGPPPGQGKTCEQCAQQCGCQRYVPGGTCSGTQCDGDAYTCWIGCTFGGGNPPPVPPGPGPQPAPAPWDPLGGALSGLLPDWLKDPSDLKAGARQVGVVALLGLAAAILLVLGLWTLAKDTPPGQAAQGAVKAGGRVAVKATTGV